MRALPPSLEARYRALKNVTGARATEVVEGADLLRRAGYPALALELLAPLVRETKHDRAYNFTMALVHWDLQDLESALGSMQQAKLLAPTNPDIAFAAAQLAFETWRPAAALFEAALRLAPDNLAITRNLAIALAEDGRTEEAVRVLSDALAERPGWIDGQRQLASILVTSGAAAFDQGFEAACGLEPRNLQLRLAWFQYLCQAKLWDAARGVLDEGRARFADENAFRLSEIYWRAETGGALTRDDLFGVHAPERDPGFDLCRVRCLLRSGNVDEARDIAAAHTDLPSARFFWPYLSLCWRLLGDDRWAWLERGGAFIEAGDFMPPGVNLAGLAKTLRALHTMKRPYVEQSVRGGTQTGRNLFLHHDALIQTFRRGIEERVRAHALGLGGDDQRHPFLAARPDAVRFSGSWSVSLKAAGFHAAHTHVLGWLSSAFYVSVPAPEDLGAPPAGYLSFGKPPPELNLNLKPFKQVAPRNGLLVMFPSFTWHGTEPFEGGERLTIAFDVAPA